jgi:hypothetical protein
VDTKEYLFLCGCVVFLLDGIFPCKMDRREDEMIYILAGLAIIGILLFALSLCKAAQIADNKLEELAKKNTK